MLQGKRHVKFVPQTVQYTDQIIMNSNAKERMGQNDYWENGVLRNVLLGTADSRSALQILRGHHSILKTVFDLVIESWISHINTKSRGYLEGIRFAFPPPQGIVINMMPFIIGDKQSLPEEYAHYWPMITVCVHGAAQNEKIGYLTIHESVTSKGTSQRRGGLHTETPGRLSQGSGYVGRRFHWGNGFTTGHFTRNGGIHMASTVEDSCEVWNVLIERPEHVVGAHGDIEHLRNYIGKGKKLQKNRIYWMTDRTPHESLPLQETQMRQYFRLITGEVSGWFEKHSTKNRLGILPDCEIITYDKFDHNASNNIYER